VIADPLAHTAENKDALLHCINLFRDLFGECDILTEDLAPFTGLKVRRLNWDVLPKGEMPWSRLQERMNPVVRALGERTAPAADFRLRLLAEEHSPDFAAVGRAGFHGYLIFGFKDSGIYVLESLFYGNATYVFGEDWERLSQMTKAEILEGDLQKDRIIHRDGWDSAMRKLLR
jgi:hypothetical protein